MQSQVPVAMPTGDNQAKPRDASQIALKASRMNLATHSMLIIITYDHIISQSLLILLNQVIWQLQVSQSF